MLLRSSLLLITSITLSFLILEAQTKDEKNFKAFSLFNVVTFKNEGCKSSSTTPSSGARNGTCYTENECEERGGMAAGSCAMGFGTCCIFTTSNCGDAVDQNCTYVRNDGFPSSITGQSTCSYTIKKCDPQVCTFRLDFEQFNLLAGTDTLDANGNCQDKFTVSGLSTGSSVVPTICGSNAGQHIYLEVGITATDDAVINFEFASATGNRGFEIKITQIICNDRMKPPEGCLQWHTGTEGRIESFNFAGNDQHLNDQQYNICIRQEEGFCCVEYAVCSDPSSFSFFPVGAVGTGTAKIDSDCSLDWIQIEASGEDCGTTFTNERYCGNHLAATGLAKTDHKICDCTQPFAVGIKTSDSTTADTDVTIPSRGVCLNFWQIPCGQIRRG